MSLKQVMVDQTTHMSGYPQGIFWRLLGIFVCFCCVASCNDPALTASREAVHPSPEPQVASAPMPVLMAPPAELAALADVVAEDVEAEADDVEAEEDAESLPDAATLAQPERQADKRNTHLRRARKAKVASAPALIPATTEVARYPSIEAPEQVQPKQRIAVQVALTEALLTPDVRIQSLNPGGVKKTQDGQLVLSLPAEQKTWTLDVVLSAPGFDFPKGNVATLQLFQVGDSTPALFELTAKAIQQPHKNTKIYATFWHKGQYLAKVVRDIRITKTLESAETHTVASSQGTATQTALAGFNLMQKVPDLTLYILDNADPERPNETQIIVNSPYLQPIAQTYYAHPGLNQWLAGYYEKFTQSRVRGLQKQAKVQTKLHQKDIMLPLMSGFGNTLYQKFAPPAFKQVFWRLSDKLGPQFDSIQIYTNNPSLPWELMKPSRLDGSDQRRFLGVEFNIARWHISENFQQLDKPPQSIRVNNIHVIAPDYKQTNALLWQAKELKSLQTLPGFRRIPSHYANLQAFFKQRPEGIIHFAGHGAVKQSASGAYTYSILLDDIELDLSIWQGLVSQASDTHPLFFFNACQVGQAHKNANVIEGWAPAVLASGASGYIGALWPLTDRGAAKFGIDFYQNLRQRTQTGGRNVAEQLRKTRQLFFQTGDPSYLAYVFYGDPNLVLLY